MSVESTIDVVTERTLVLIRDMQHYRERDDAPWSQDDSFEAVATEMLAGMAAFALSLDVFDGMDEESGLALLFVNLKQAILTGGHGDPIFPFSAGNA